jgi:hypothetical protein
MLRSDEVELAKADTQESGTSSDPVRGCNADLHFGPACPLPPSR